MFKRLLVVCLSALFVIHAQAQPLADQVPGDALVYVGWRGADDPDSGYAGSNLEALGGAEELSRSLAQTLDLVERANAQNPWAGLVCGLVRSIGSSSWHLPTTAYLQAVDDGDMPVRLTISWQAQGEPREALLASLQTLMQQVPPQAPVMVKEGDGLVSLMIGQPPEANAHAVPAPGLFATPGFKKAMAQVKPDGVLVVYADAKGLIELFDRIIADGSPHDYEEWAKARSVMGLDGLESLAISGGFDGPDWRTDLFLGAPAPRQGILSMLDAEPITDEELTCIPAEATWFTATRLDLGKVLDEVKRVVNGLEPGAGEELTDALLKADEMTGVDIEDDLIRALGSAWVFYTDPGAVGSGMMGLCLVNELKDAEAVERSLVSLQALANAMMGQAGAEAGFRIRFHSRDDQGMTLHTLGIPFIAPTWSIHDGKLYVGLYPQTVMTAGDRARSGGKRIVDDEKFQAARARLGVAYANSIVYTDLPNTAEGAYQNLVMLSQIGSGALAMFGGDNAVLLPPYARIKPLLKPAAQATWTDDQGLHMRAIGPFPGSELFGPQGTANATTAPLMVGTLLPALGAARRSARQMKNTTQCRGIVQSQVVFAIGNKERMSDDIAELVQNNHFAVEYAISPNIETPIPWDFQEWDQAQQNAWVRHNASYVLIPNLKNTIDSRVVCVFERPDHSDGSGLAVGFCDGSAQFVADEWEVRELVQAQTGKTLEELVERQQNYQPPAE